MLKVQVWSHTLDDFDPSVYVWEDDGSDRFKTENQIESGPMGLGPLQRAV